MSYEFKTAEYEIATLSIKDEQSEGKYAPSGDITADREEVDVLLMQLSAVLSKAKAVGESISRESSNSINAPLNQIKSDIVKLQKISCPTFSGSPRDFGHFKREFCELVKVPGRSDIEIGKHLKNAVPDKFLHLINHLQTSDHEEMMKRDRLKLKLLFLIQ